MKLKKYFILALTLMFVMTSGIAMAVEKDYSDLFYHSITGKIKPFLNGHPVAPVNGLPVTSKTVGIMSHPKLIQHTEAVPQIRPSLMKVTEFH